MPEINLDKYYHPDIDLAYAFAYMLFPRNEDETLRKLYLAYEIVGENLNPHKYISDKAAIPKELIKAIIDHEKPRSSLTNKSNCEKGASVGRIFLSILRIHASNIPVCITGARELAASQLKIAANSINQKTYSYSTATLQTSTSIYKRSAHLWASLIFMLDNKADIGTSPSWTRDFIGNSEVFLRLYKAIPEDQKNLLPFDEDDFWRFPIVDPQFVGLLLLDKLTPNEAEMVQAARARDPRNKK